MGEPHVAETTGVASAPHRWPSAGRGVGMSRTERARAVRNKRRRRMVTALLARGSGRRGRRCGVPRLPAVARAVRDRGRRLRGRRRQGRRHRGAQRRLDDHDRADPARQGGGGHREGVRGRRSGQCGDLRDPTRLLQGAHRDSRRGCRCATCGSAEPRRPAGDPGGPSARRHHRRQDQRRHQGHLLADLRMPPASTSTAPRSASRPTI